MSYFETITSAIEIFEYQDFEENPYLDKNSDSYISRVKYERLIDGLGTETRRLFQELWYYKFRLFRVDNPEVKAYMRERIATIFEAIKEQTIGCMASHFGFDPCSPRCTYGRY